MISGPFNRGEISEDLVVVAVYERAFPLLSAEAQLMKLLRRLN